MRRFVALWGRPPSAVRRAKLDSDVGRHNAITRLDFPFPHATMIQERPRMNIEIRDSALQARIQKQLELTGSGSVEELLARLLETQEEQDRWLLENRDDINAKIGRGLAQLDRGEGIPEEQLDARLKTLKAKSR